MLEYIMALASTIRKLHPTNLNSTYNLEEIEQDRSLSACKVLAPLRGSTPDKDKDVSAALGVMLTSGV